MRYADAKLEQEHCTITYQMARRGYGVSSAKEVRKILRIRAKCQKVIQSSSRRG